MMLVSRREGRRGGDIYRILADLGICEVASRKSRRLGRA